MSIRNHCQFIGRIGSEPEVKSFGEGNKLANFSLAIDESYKDKFGEWVNKVQWVNCTVFGEGFANRVERVGEKGLMVAVLGEYKSEKWIDRDENERTRVYFKIQEFSPMQQTKKSEGKTEEKDDLPF